MLDFFITLFWLFWVKVIVFDIILASISQVKADNARREAQQLAALKAAAKARKAAEKKRP